MEYQIGDLLRPSRTKYLTIYSIDPVYYTPVCLETVSISAILYLGKGIRHDTRYCHCLVTALDGQEWHGDLDLTEIELW